LIWSLNESYSIKDILKRMKISEENKPPIFFDEKTRKEGLRRVELAGEKARSFNDEEFEMKKTGN